MTEEEFEYCEQAERQKHDEKVKELEKENAELEAQNTQKEIEDYLVESTGYGRDKIRNFMDIINKALFQKSERIAVLEEEKCELLGIIQGKDKVIADLEKENAELKANLDYAKAVMRELLDNATEYSRQIAEDFIAEGQNEM